MCYLDKVPTEKKIVKKSMCDIMQIIKANLPVIYAFSSAL